MPSRVWGGVYLGESQTDKVSRRAPSETVNHYSLELSLLPRNRRFTSCEAANTSFFPPKTRLAKFEQWMKRHSLWGRPTSNVAVAS